MSRAEPGTLPADLDGRVCCHVCGRWYVNLAQHARLAHGYWADEYRETFGLNRTTALVGPALSARHAALARARDQARFLTPLLVRPGDARPPHRLEGRQRNILAAQTRRRITVLCAWCKKGVETYPHRRNQPTYCPACGEARQRQRHREAMRRRRASK